MRSTRFETTSRPDSSSIFRCATPACSPTWSRRWLRSEKSPAPSTICWTSPRRTTRQRSTRRSPPRRYGGQVRAVLRGAGRQRGRQPDRIDGADDHGSTRRAGRWPDHRDVPADLPARSRRRRRLIRLFSFGPYLDTLAAHGWVIATFVAWLGLAFGSFLNVVIYRLPVMLDRQWKGSARELLELPAQDHEARFDLIAPASRCPACATPIRAIHNVPVLSWLWLRGRC